MTNTQRGTTVCRDGDDNFVHSQSSETSTSRQDSDPLVSSASIPTRQVASHSSSGSSRSVRFEVRQEPPTQTGPAIIRSRYSVALIDNDTAHAAKLADRLRFHQLALIAHCELNDALPALQGGHFEWDIVIVNVSDPSQPWLAILRRLQEACSSHGSRHFPLFLCTSRIKRDPQFQLALERLGVRFVYER